MSETPAFPQEKRGGDLSGMHGHLLLLISVLAVSSWVPKRTQAAHNTCATHQKMARCSVWAAGPGRMISACAVETKAASHSTLPFPPPKTGVSWGRRFTNGACALCCPREPFLGSQPTSPLLDVPLVSWNGASPCVCTSLLCPGCSHEGL